MRWFASLNKVSKQIFLVSLEIIICFKVVQVAKSQEFVLSLHFSSPAFLLGVLIEFLWAQEEPLDQVGPHALIREIAVKPLHREEKSDIT